MDQNLDISLKLFAHINNDAFIAGTRNLEGLPYSTTIQFLQHFLKNSNGLLLPEVLERNQTSLTTLQQKLDSLLMASKELENVHTKIEDDMTLKEAECPLREATASIVERIFKMLADSGNQVSVLMPGGWSGKSSGHSIAYEFKKDAEGNLLFFLYNSGAGQNYHEEFATTDKQRYQTVKCFKIPKTEINQEKITDFVVELVKARVLPRLEYNSLFDKQYDEERLYTQIFPKIFFLNGEEIDPQELAERRIASIAQRTGTCTEKSLHELIKNSLENKEDAKYIILCLKIYSIELFLKKDPVVVSDPKNLSQLKWAVENLSRIIDKQGDALSLGYAAIQQRAIQLIEIVEKLFNESGLTPKEMHKQCLQGKFNQLEIFEGNFSIPQAATQVVFSAETIMVEPYDHDRVDYVQSAIDQDLFSIDKLKSFIEQLEFLCKAGLYIKVEQQTFHYFTTLPLASNYFTSVDSVEKANDLIKLIHNLLAQYGDAIKINNKNDKAPLSPKRLVALLSVIEIIDLALKSKNLGLISHGIENFSIRFDAFKKSVKFNPYLATHSSELDMRIKSILNRFSISAPVTKKLSNLSDLITCLRADEVLYTHLNLLYNNKKQTNALGLSKEEQKLIEDKYEAAIAYIYFLEKEPSTHQNEANKIRLFKETILLMDCIANALRDFDLSAFKNREVKTQWIYIDNQKSLKESFEPEYGFESLSKDLIRYFNPIQDQEVEYSLTKDFIHSIRSSFESRETFYDDNEVFSKPNGTENIFSQTYSWLYQELMHLRTSPALQLLTTTDFFNNNLDLFSGDKKIDLHQCLKANIFQPGILIDTLKNNPDSLEQFNQFINKAIAYYSEKTQNQLSENVLAFYELQVDVNIYALAFLQDGSPLKEKILTFQQKKLDELNKLELKRFSVLAKYIVAKLKVKLYLNLIKQGYFNQDRAKTVFNFFMDFSFHGRTVSFTVQEERDFHKELADTCVNELFISKENIYDFSIEWARKNGIQDALLEKIKPSPQSNYPYFYGVDVNGKVMLSLDLIKGEIILEEGSIGYLPENIANSTLYRESQLAAEMPSTLFSIHVCRDVIENKLVKKYKALNALTPVVFFETINKLGFPVLIYQQEKTVNNDTQYYEKQIAFVQKKPDHFTFMNCHLDFPDSRYTTYFSIDLPALFFGNETKYWVALDNKTILIEKGENRYCFDKISKQVKELDQQNLETGFVLSTLSAASQILSVVEKFENKEFVEVLLRAQEGGHKTLKIKFVRYNMELHGQFNEQKKQWVIHVADKPNLVLVDNSNIGMQPLIPNGLVFEDLQSKKRFIYTPNQFYFVSKTADKNKAENCFGTVYHKPILDTSNVSKRSHLGMGVKELETLFCFSRVSQKLPQGKATHTNTEKYYRYEINSKTNELQAISSEEKLYLAYLNLIHIQPAAALKSIQSIMESGGLRGSVEELEVINKILTGTPLFATQIDSPEFIAVKLHVLYLISDLKAQQKDFVLPDSKSLPDNTPDTYWLKEQNEQLESLKSSFSKLTQKYLEDNLNNRANIPKSMRLLPALEYKILSSVEMKKNRNLQLKNRYEQLKNWYRIRELAKLQASEETKNNRENIERLKNKITQLKQVMHPINKFKAKHSVEIVLQKSKNTFNPGNLGFNSFISLIRVNASVNIKSGLSDKNFLKQFNSIFQLAGSIQPDLATEREELRLFLNQTFKSSCFVSIEKQKSIIPTWAAILLTVFDYPSEFQSFLSYPGDYAFQIFRKAFELNPIREIEVNGCFPTDEIVDITSKYKKNIMKKIDKYTPSPMDISDTPKEYEGVLYEAFLTKAELNEFYYAVKELENKTDIEILEKKEELRKKISDRRSEETIELRRKYDEEIGAIKNQKTRELYEITKSHLADTQKQENIVFECECMLKKLGGLIETTQKTVLNLANQGPTDDLKLQKKYQLALSGRKREKLKLNDLNRLFVLADKKEYERVTGLNKEVDIQTLHDTMAQYVNYGILKTQYEKIKNELNKFKCDLVLMSTLTDGMPEKAEFGKLYVSNDGSYITRNPEGIVCEGTLKNLDIDLSDLENKLKDVDFKKAVLEITSKRGHTLLNCGTNDEFKGSEKEIEVTQLGEALAAKNIVSVREQPAFQFFQYAEEKLIRPIQQYFLNKLLNINKETGKFYNEVIQIIMGGGKSKLIGPLAVLNKANGTNLVIFQVKSSLLKINHADMAATSQRLFNQKAILFEFDRTSPSTSHDLKQLYKLLYTTSVDKNYIVTSGTSLQSLELKYLETLANPPAFENPQAMQDSEQIKKLEKETAEWKKQIKWFEKSLLLLKLKGDRIIDEIHDELDPTKELNYTLDEAVPPSSEDIKLSMDLFFFLREVSITDIVGVESNAYDLILNNKLISDPKNQFDMIMERIATQLVNQHVSPGTKERNPIAAILNKLNLVEQDSLTEEQKKLVREQDNSLLIAFLLGKNDKILPKLEANLTPREIDELSFIKFELSTILPFTLGKNYNEHYGPSRKVGISAINRKLAIPYKALNTPNERARFGQYIEAMNYTIQMNLIEPLSAELILELINEYKHKAKIEILNSNELAFNETDASQEFEKIFGYNLEIILNLNKEELDNLVNTFQHSETFKKAFLASKALPLVQINPTVLSSNSQNLGSMTHTTQGMTGTPWNYKSYHQDIYFDEIEGIGTDGETIDLLQSEKKNNTVVVCEAYTQVEKLLEELLSKELDNFKKVRAIIDVGALFKQEVSNLEVAKKIGVFYKNNDQRLGTTTKFILYVDNQDNQLYAWDVKKQSSIKLEESDEKAISKILNCKPEERFTFYDQARITGTDITQGSHARALVTFSDKTTQSELLQGVKRLRQFTHNQSVTLIQPSYLAKNNRVVPEMKRVLEFVNKNQVDKCLQTHLKATAHKFKNVLRNNFMDFIYQEQDAHKKHELLKLFYSFFSKSYHSSHFKNYGAIESNLDAQNEYFEPLAQKYYDQWLALIKNAGLSISTEKQAEIQNGLNNIAKAGVESCAAKILSTPIQPFDANKEEKQKVDLDAQVENQIENDNETDKELHLDQELLTDENKVKAYTDVVPFTLANYLNPNSDLMRNSPPIQANNNYMIGQECLFDQNIMVSAMQAKTILSQSTYYAKNVKPIHAVLMMVDKNLPESESLNAFVLAKKEANYYGEMNTTELQALHPDKQVWLVSPSNKLLAGTRPEKLPSGYLRVLEQIKFINGDCSLITQQKNGVTWLKENTETKLKFLRETILPRFKYKAKFYHLLTKRLKALSKQQVSVLQSDTNHNNEEGERKVVAETRKIKLKLNLKRKNQKTMPAIVKHANTNSTESERKGAAETQIEMPPAANLKRKQNAVFHKGLRQPKKNHPSEMYNGFTSKFKGDMDGKKRQVPAFQRKEQPEGTKRPRVSGA